LAAHQAQVNAHIARANGLSHVQAQHDVHIDHIVPAPAPVPLPAPAVVGPVAPVPRVALQGATAPLDINEIAVAGERCIDKIIVQEETVTDESIECHHRLEEQCYSFCVSMKNPFRKCIFDHVQIHLPRNVVNFTKSS
jgi:hypothetical protein